MSHVPFMAIAPSSSDDDAEATSSSSTPHRRRLDANDIRAPSDSTASAISSISPTSNMATLLKPSLHAQRNALSSSSSSSSFSAPVTTTTTTTGTATTTSSSNNGASTSAKSAKRAPLLRRLPAYVALPLAVMLSLGLSAALYSAVPGLVGFQLASVSRSLNEAWEIGGLVAWKVVLLGVVWGAGLDFWDVSYLSLLINTPYYSLLYLFYDLPTTPLLYALAIDTASLALPFYLLRPVNLHNALKSTFNAQTIADISADRSIQFYMTVFAAAMYSLIVYTSFLTYLPTYMILHFDEVKTLEHAHNALLPWIFLSCLPLALAANYFLFCASIAASRAAEAVTVFNPVTASFSETLSYNLAIGPHTGREAVLARRTMLLVGLCAANAFVRVFGTVEGTEAVGAAGWAALWAVANLTVGLGFAWAGDA